MQYSIMGYFLNGNRVDQTFNRKKLEEEKSMFLFLKQWKTRTTTKYIWKIHHYSSAFDCDTAHLAQEDFEHLQFVDYILNLPMILSLK